jgi:hypothetical protein
MRTVAATWRTVVLSAGICLPKAEGDEVRRPAETAEPQASSSRRQLFQFDAGVFACRPFVARLKLLRDVELSLCRKMIRTRLMRPAKPSAVLGTSSFSHLLTWAR